MDESRDTELGRQLEAFGEPDHGPEYWRDVRLRVAEAKADAAAKAGRPSFGRRLRAAFALRRARLALVAAVLAAAATAVVFVGLPGTPGPQTVSAAEVLDRALTAYSSGRTWQADVRLRLFDEATWEKWHAYVTRRAHIVRSADGSYHETWSPVMAAGHRLDRGLVETYDASTGKAAPYYEVETGKWVAESTPALGPPDSGTVPLVDIGTTIRALASSGTLRLDETVVDGRPAWTVTCTKGEMAGLPLSDVDWPEYTVTIDKVTAQLVAVREKRDGMVTFAVRFRNVRVDEPLPDDVFVAPRVPPGAAVRRVDLGFHRVDLDEGLSTPGITPLVPAFIPYGYRLSHVAIAQRAVTDNHAVRARNVLALKYSRGFDSLVVSTRTIDDRYYLAETDPCEGFDQAWSKLARTEATIASGAFAGATARILVASTTSAPHLWAVKDGVLLTVAGGATADELLKVAESLQVYPGPSPAAQSAPCSPTVAGRAADNEETLRPGGLYWWRPRSPSAGGRDHGPQLVVVIRPV